MKKELIGIFVCMLLIATAVAQSTAVVPNIENMTNNELVFTPVTSGKTIYVDDDNTEGPWDGTIVHPYQYIQDGIDNASDGDTVYVFDGTYYKHNIIDKEMDLIGEDKNTTIIDGGNVVIKNNGVQITGFTIKDNSGQDGIRADGSGSRSNIIIKNNIISNRRYGISLKRHPNAGSSTNIQITKNIITNNHLDGIYIGGSCTEFGNEKSYFLENTITYNYIANNRYGIHMPCWAKENIIKLNEIRDNKKGILFGWEPTSCFPGSWWNRVIKNNFINNEENAYFYEYRNFWYRNYWDDWDGTGKYSIHGLCCYGEEIEAFDYFPAREPYNITNEDVVVGKTETFSLQDNDLLEEIVNDIIARFQDAETQESKIAILKEIPIVMDTYGLLPEDMTVEETQELIVSSYLETLSSDSFQSDQQSNIAGDNSLGVSNNVFPSSLLQLQVSKSNRNNNIKLNPPQPAPWPPENKCVRFGFGWISNLKWEFNGDEYYYSFNCENVICKLWDGTGQWYHYTNGEKLYIYCMLFQIITEKFIFII